MISSDQAALHTQVADGALQLGLRGFEVGLGCSHIALGPVEFGGHLAELRRSVGLDLADLFFQLRVAL